MITSRFMSLTLRTIDVPAATAFYEAVLGSHGHRIVPLHEQARARGARPHWLGRVGSGDPRRDEEAVAVLERAGGERLGPHPDGGVVLREPGGALLAVGGATASPGSTVGWHVLRTPNPERAASLYGEAFGWTVVDVGAIDGVRHQRWSAAPGEPPCGAIAALSEGVHPQWLHLFVVPSIGIAVDTVRRRGGLALEPRDVDGRRFTACDDPQGAAFGLME